MREKGKKAEKPKVKTDMMRAEADNWPDVLRQTLCAVVEGNVKSVTLPGKNFHSHDMANEDHWVELRKRDFGGEELT